MRVRQLLRQVHLHRLRGVVRVLARVRHRADVLVLRGRRRERPHEVGRQRRGDVRDLRHRRQRRIVVRSCVPN